MEGGPLPMKELGEAADVFGKSATQWCVMHQRRDENEQWIEIATARLHGL